MNGAISLQQGENTMQVNSTFLAKGRITVEVELRLEHVKGAGTTEWSLGRTWTSSRIVEVK